ncbi:Glutamyl-tRNA amidotransferase B subunit [Marasmius fiardii PR-910]|nr:Glutamyl-tRNA amidotransferase B subunit [Marasmius fiardii PR-910]
MARLLFDGWQTVIGIETHVQLKCRQKLFSRATNGLLSDSPNSRYNVFDAAFPGTLPKLNPKCVELAVRAALALNCDLKKRSKFDRKHYFYPDQPVGYQITQHYSPFALNGTLTLPKLGRRVRIKQIQLEQDTGKSIFNPRTRSSLIDLNRAGAGLLEIVTEPDLRSTEEAADYVRSLQTLLRSMGVSDGNMEAGSLRCDINISVNRHGEPFGTRCEIKNVNSVRFMVAAIQYEIERQKGILSASSSSESSPPQVSQETRGFDEHRWETYTIRSKEDAPDYRYMPDPNLGTLVLDENIIKRIRSHLPLTPEATRNRLIATYGPSGVTEASIDVLMGLDSSQDVPFDGVMIPNDGNAMSAVDYFESVGKDRDPREVINWITQTFLGLLSVMRKPFSTSAVPVSQMGALIDMASNGEMTRSSGRLLLRYILQKPLSADMSVRGLAEELDLVSGGPAHREDEICQRAIAALPSEVAAFRSGNKNVLNRLIGWVMKETKGKVDVQQTRNRLEDLISKM